MYGANFGPEGSDNCGGPGGLSPSYVYRVNLKTLAIDKVGQVGMVPKYVAVTPDDKYVLVTQLVQLRPQRPRLRHARTRSSASISARTRAGSRSTASEQVAYVAVMGSFDVARVDLRSFALSYFRGVGNSPRHLVLSNDGRAPVRHAERRQPRRRGRHRDRPGRARAPTTGSQPRSMAISSDGQALYVVNYASNTVSVLKASDLSVVRSVPGARPPDRHRVRTDARTACGSRATAARSSSTTPESRRGTPRRAVTAGSRPRG